MNIGEKIQLEIKSVTYGVESLGYYNGFVVFVPFTVPGDIVDAEITNLAKNFARAKILAIVKPSSNRIDSVCKHFGECGGCHWQNIKYEYQLKYKEDIVRNTLKRIGKLDDVLVQPTIAIGKEFEYRNKIQIQVVPIDGNCGFGFYALKSHYLIDINSCPVQTKEANKLLLDIKEEIIKYKVVPYNEKDDSGILRHIVIRIASSTQEAMVIFVAAKEINTFGFIAKTLIAKNQNLTSVILNVNEKKGNVVLSKTNKTIAGRGFINERLGEIKFVISPNSFFQVNTDAALNLYKVIVNILEFSGKETVLDLYSGIGSIALFVSKYALKVIGVEGDKNAVIDATRNVHLNNIMNCEFRCGDVNDMLQEIVDKKELKPDVVILDPPRKGCTQDVIKNIVKLAPKNIIYVSCDPATLSRDLEKFKELGYKTCEVQPLDMFPHTFHIESIAKLYKSDCADTKNS
ncbi:MAG: 23S rRNA (uracil(1939)-C(5))-methyltransferase RlmD [Candidatus Firestonebacteria bacterium]